MITRFTVLFAAVLMLTACDNTIDPFDDETGLFSVYGYVTLNEEASFIRVRDLNQPPTHDSTARIDATVTLYEPDSGQSEQLAHHRTEFENGFAHNFRSDMDIAPNTRYVLEVTRSDGRTVSASTRSPHIISPDIAPRGDNCLESIRVTFADIHTPSLIRPTIGFSYLGDKYWIRHEMQDRRGGGIEFSFTPEAILEDTIPLQDDESQPFWYYPRCAEMEEPVFQIAYQHLGNDWRNQDRPINPLESLDVEGGLGFFGALRHDTLTVAVDTAAIDMSPV